jgi:MoxR-like ATPase
MEGTYPLPEAQLDRFFFKIIVPHPSRAELEEIVTRTTGTTVAKVGRVTDRDGLLEIQSLVREMPIGPAVSSYAVRLVEATHPGSRDADWQRLIRYGASPRGAQSLVLAAKAFALLAGRANVGFDDVARAALPALRHRIILSFQGEAEGHGTDEIIERILEEVSTEPHGNSA